MAPSPPCCACRISYSFSTSVTRATGDCYFAYSEVRSVGERRGSDFAERIRQIERQAEAEEIRLALRKAKLISHKALKELLRIVEYVCPSQPRQQAKQSRWLGLLQRK